MQTDLTEDARRVCKPEEILGATVLINHLGKACFIQGLHNERIQTIVRSRGESILLSQAIEISLQEQSAILSVTERSTSGASGPPLRRNNCNKFRHTANKCFSSSKFPSAVKAILSYFTSSGEGHLAKDCPQGRTCRKCSRKGHTANVCRAQSKGWIRSGNYGRESSSNPTMARPNKQ
jgi:hypothetical protein